VIKDGFADALMGSNKHWECTEKEQELVTQAHPIPIMPHLRQTNRDQPTSKRQARPSSPS